MNRVGYPLSLNQMTFTINTNHKVFLEEEIYVKLVASAEAKAERYNKMWAVREEEGKTYHTRKTFYGEEKIYWYGETKSFLNITFGTIIGGGLHVGVGKLKDLNTARKFKKRMKKAGTPDEQLNLYKEYYPENAPIMKK